MSARAKRVLLAVVSLGLLLVGGSVYAAFAAPSKPDIAMQVAPASQSVARGSSAIYTVTVTSLNGFTGSVVLTAGGQPSGATASFTPTSVKLTSGAAATASLNISTSSSTPVGAYTLTISGSSGSGGSKVSASVTAGLTVNYPLSGALKMSATPDSVSMSPGDTAVYTVQLVRTNLTGPVTLGVTGGLPNDSSVTSTPTSITGNSATLQISTKSSTNEATYPLTLVASGTDVNNVKQYAYANVQLVVTTQGKAFAITGNLPGNLAPGVSIPLNLKVSNPNHSDLAVSNLTVTVQSVAKAAGASGTCSVTDYTVDQYSGPYPLVVPSLGSADLGQLNVGPAYWPHVRMLDKAVNQDGCKGATLTLAYNGFGQGTSQ
ncbi:MAG TPA: hypothetical protein VFH38_02180 [Jatrophihabitans sp.]|nr:hypothetical protein [Jatrophihabitans sp.]